MKDGEKEGYSGRMGYLRLLLGKPYMQKTDKRDIEEG